MGKMDNWTMVGAKLPGYICAEWANWCLRHGLTQASAIRMALADYIYNDETATNAELALAAQIEDLPLRPYRLRVKVERPTPAVLEPIVIRPNSAKDHQSPKWGSLIQ